MENHSFRPQRESVFGTLADNLGAAKGRLPDASMRTRMEQLFDSF